MTCVPLEPRTALSQSSEPQKDQSPQGTIFVERTWNPLIVPREWYLREGLSWQPHQPVSLTVEVNGKRDSMKYAAVMQMEPKMGFVARLGHPGAAVKFQSLHLVDVRRIGRNDIHICLGDLAWTQARAGVTLATAAALLPSVLPSSRSASPGVSEAGMAVAPESCVLGGGAATGGLLSGISSEGISGIDGIGSTPAAGSDMDAGANSDSRSQGDAASDTDEKAIITSAAGESGGTPTSCSLAAPATSTGPIASDAIGIAHSPGPARRPPAAIAHPLRCSCMLCPCQVDAERLSAASSDQHPTHASPHASIIAGPEKSASKTGREADRRMAEAAALGAGVLTGSCVLSPSKGAPLSDTSAGGSTSHLSYERLRDLALPPILKSSSVTNVLKVAALGTSDGGRPNGALPASTATVLHGAASGAIAASDTQVKDGVGSDLERVGQIIDRELLLPPEVATERTSDTHVFAQVEIDSRLEDCKIQLRLGKSADGQTLSLQGVSQPLRGLQLISISEAGGGDIFIKAKTPSPNDVASVAAALIPPVASAGKARAAAPLSAASGSAGVPATGGVFFGRSFSGRQRRPSLKLREGAEEPMLSGARRSGAAANASGLPPLYPSTCEAALRGELASVPPQQSEHPAKRRGIRATTRTQRVPAAAAALLLLPAKTKADGAAVGQIQDCKNGYNNRSHGSKGNPKWEQTSTAKRRTLPSCMTSGEAVPEKGKRRGDELEILQLEERQCSYKRSRREAAAGGLLPPPASTGANAGSSARPAVAETGRERWASNCSSGINVMEEGPSPERVSAIDMVLVNVSGEDIAEHQVEQLQERIRPSGNLRRTQNPTGRVCRKRLFMPPSVDAAGPATAEVFSSEQLAEYSVKQRKTGTRDTLQGAKVVEAGGEGRRQQLEMYLQESSQGSETALPCDDPAGRERNTGSRGVVRRAQQLQWPQQPFPSSESSDGAEEAEDPTARGAYAVEAMADTGVSDFTNYGAAAGEGSDPALADAQRGPDAGAPSRQKTRGRASLNKAKGKPNRHPSKISNVIRNAGAILLMIGVGSSEVVYEKQLRATFGNNPDTSKALRLLEEQGKVKREGLGYRMHPYHYTLTPEGCNEYERLLDEAGPSYSFASSMGVRLPRRSVLPAAAGGLADCDLARAKEGGDAVTLDAAAALGRTTPEMEVGTEVSAEVRGTAAMAPAEAPCQPVSRQPGGSSAVAPYNSAQPCRTSRGVAFNGASSSTSVKDPAATGDDAPTCNLASSEAAAEQLQRDSAAHESGGQMPSSNPYAFYSYVLTPFGYMPFSVYSSYAAAATGAHRSSISGPGQVVSAPAPLTTGVSDVQIPAGWTSQPGACGKTHFIAPTRGAATAAKAPLVPPPPPPTPTMIPPVQPPAQPQTVACASRSKDAGGVEHHNGCPKDDLLRGTGAAATAALLPLPQAPAPPARSHPPALASATISVAATPSPSHPSLPQPLSNAQQLQHFAPPELRPPPQQQQEKQQPPKFRYVVKLPEGRYHAEVPSASGVMYYSPSFAQEEKAAAAADLLMAKLQPGERFNFGFSEEEGQALASLTVEQVQAMLWCMADGQSSQ